MKKNAAAKAGIRAGPSSRLGIVVIASSAGTAFEWYDFFVFGTLTGLISKTFFAGLTNTTGYAAALALFGVGFLFRPLGALVFGRLGDRVGRKKTFLATILLMGAATVGIGLLPTYAQVGLVAPILLLLLRIIQGFAVGGEYGGAATYVAEHAPADRRGRATSWIQSSAAFGLVGALAVIFICRTLMGEAAFEAWGWRLPFLFSIVLLVISVWMRLSLAESPEFERMKAQGAQSTRPYTETFARWPNLKLVLIAFFGVMIGQAATWYTTFFYTQIFMERFLKAPPRTIALLMMGATAASVPGYYLCGRLSDRIGRKPVLMFGMAVMLVGCFPAFHVLTRAVNPALAEANARVPVTIVADPADCSLQIDPLGKTSFLSSCDIAKSALSNAGINYANAAGPRGALAQVRIGSQIVRSATATGLPPAKAKVVKAAVEARLKAALTEAGYPATADPARTNLPLVFGVLLVFVLAASAVYGPLAAAGTELFPTRIRYTALSVPYHIGSGWVGGFVPFTAFAIVTAKGDIYSGLWFPLAFVAISFVTAAFFLPETKGRDLSHA